MFLHSNIYSFSHFTVLQKLCSENIGISSIIDTSYFLQWLKMGSGVVKVVILLYCNRPRLLGLPHDAVSISFSLCCIIHQYCSYSLLNCGSVTHSVSFVLFFSVLASPSHQPQPVVADGCPFLSLVLPEVSSCLLIGGDVTASVSIIVASLPLRYNKNLEVTAVVNWCYIS